MNPPPSHETQLARALEEIRTAIALLSDRSYATNVDIWIKLKTASMLLRDAEYLVERAIAEMRRG